MKSKLFVVLAVFSTLVSFRCSEADLDAPEASEPGTEPQVLRLGPAHDTIIEAAGVGFRMVFVPGGTFSMGASPLPDGQAFDPEADPMEQPVHQVTLDPFLICEHEVMQFLYYAVMGSNPSDPKDLEKPVNKLDFNKAQTFIDSLSRLTGFRFRMPTEAEWEYAAKGAAWQSPPSRYAGSDDPSAVGWYETNSNATLQRVAQLQPNALGLYDMSGNVMEWCSDWYGEYSADPQINPQGASKPEYPNLQRHAIRGGSFLKAPRYMRNTARYFLLPSESEPDMGLRLALSVAP